MGFIVRKATSADALDIAIVHTVSWQSAYKGIVDDKYLASLNIDNKAERFKHELIKFNGTHFFVGENGRQTIGILFMHKSRDLDLQEAGEIGAIYLLPEYWGMGFGKQMMNFAMQKLKEMNFSTIILWVLQNNFRARSFYEKCGFAFEGMKREITIVKPITEIRYIYHFQ